MKIRGYVMEAPKAYKSYLPDGRAGRFIYAVELKEHPGVVKVGRTSKWSSRRLAYATWNLSDGNAIARERVFTITDENDSDLGWVEAELLAALPFDRRFGKEWLVADFDDVCRLIDRKLCELDLPYD